MGMSIGNGKNSAAAVNGAKTLNGESKKVVQTEHDEYYKGEGITSPLRRSRSVRGPYCENR